MNARRILVVDDESLIRWSLAERLRSEGYEVIEAKSASEATEKAVQGVDLVLLDVRLPDDNGFTVLRRLRDADPDAIIVMLTVQKDVASVVEAMKAGAFDYIAKPFDLDDVVLRVSRALDATRMRRELRTLRDTLSRPYTLESIIGQSAAMRRVKELIVKIADSPGSTVLLTGESGTGKDLIAKVIHYMSRRAARPFLNITCSALPESLLESELFGHERGAFTDARQQKRGLFEQADDGTVFLDEIGEMAPALQAKLLRVLEEKTFRRVGGSGEVTVDVRVIAATNQELEAQVRAGKFREDLFFRLNVLRIEVPPLRARREDIPLLTSHFVLTFCHEFKRPTAVVSSAADEALMSHGWPGNVRELRNMVERAVLLSEGSVLQPSDFDSLRAGIAHVSDNGQFELPPEGVNLEEVERNLVVQALERTGGNQTKAATLLGLHRDQIRYRIEKFGLRK
jgi:two-component system response regulator AtoC